MPISQAFRKCFVLIGILLDSATFQLGKGREKMVGAIGAIWGIVGITLILGRGLLCIYPFSRELCRVTHAERPLDRADIERQLRIQARMAKQAFESAAKQAGIPHSFHTRRGSLAKLLQQAVEEMDLMILGPASRLRQWSRPVSLSAIAHHSRQPVVVLYDDTGSSERVLLTAKQLAKSGDRQLSVMMTSENREAALKLQHQAEQILDGLPARYHFMATKKIASLVDMCRNERAGTLVIGVSDPLLKHQSLQELSDHLECPALLVR